MITQEMIECAAIEYAERETMWSLSWKHYLAEFEAALIERGIE